MSSFVSIARIAKTYGVKGEVAADVLTDFPERFGRVGDVRLWDGTAERQETLERHWFHKDRVMLKFSGINSPEEARKFLGYYVQVPEDERYVLPAGTYYYSDLEGCEVFEKDQRLGRVVRIEDYGTAPNLVIRDAGGNEAMIPMVRQFVRRVDVEAKEIEVELPRGLIEETATSEKPRKKRR